MKRVFVSYSLSDLDAVKLLIRDLQAIGVDTWHDETLTGGQRWWDDILANIRECGIFVFVLSPGSLKSEACKSELSYAQKLDKPILPVLVADGVNLNLLPDIISGIQVTDFRSRETGSLFALFKAIMSAPLDPRLPDPLPDAPQVPVSYLTNLKDRIESVAPLSPQEQITLLFELEDDVRDGQSPEEARVLLRMFKQRDDLLAKIAAKIDDALQDLESPQAKTKSASPYRSSSNFCPRCGEALSPESKFCGRCGHGTPVAGYAIAAPAGPEPTVSTDEVIATVFAPNEAAPGNSFLVQVFAHLEEQASALEAIAQRADMDTKWRIQAELKKWISRGTTLTFNLTMSGLEIDQPSQSSVWNGRPAQVQFGVTVPAECQPKDIVGLVVVCEKTVPIGHLRFKFRISAAASTGNQAVRVGSTTRYRQAFISYASSDRSEVLKRVQMLNSIKLKCFQDLLTLEPGDEWEKLIYKYIDQSDVFFLFWSRAASESAWVRKEIQYAMQRKRNQEDAAPEIVPVIIEGPPPAKPPPDLAFLHFNDKFLYFINPPKSKSG